MDSITGPVLAQAAPTSNNAGGTFSVDVTVPNVDAGDHVVVVTQNDVNGAPAYGTPARTVLSVVAAPLAPIFVPVATAPIPLGTVPVAPVIAPVQTAAQKLAKAVAKCKRMYNVSKAKTAAGRKRVASRRSSCISRAKRAANA